MERKEFALELKGIEETGVFEGYASIFGNVDKGGDKVVPGAFVDGLKRARQSGRTIKMLWNHNPDELIGVWDDLAEDAKGLWGKGHLVMEVARAREVHALAKAGAIGGLSIGYNTLKSAPDGNVRMLEKVDLWEVSLVTFPMNDRAKLTDVKADDDLVNKLKAGDRLTEREFEMLVKGLGLSNSQAERAARIHLKGPGEPVAAASEAQEFYRAILGK